MQSVQKVTGSKQGKMQTSCKGTRHVDLHRIEIGIGYMLVHLRIITAFKTLCRSEPNGKEASACQQDNIMRTSGKHNTAYTSLVHQHITQ